MARQTSKARRTRRRIRNVLRSPRYPFRRGIPFRSPPDLNLAPGVADALLVYSRHWLRDAGSGSHSSAEAREKNSTFRPSRSPDGREPFFPVVAGIAAEGRIIVRCFPHRVSIYKKYDRLMRSVRSPLPKFRISTVFLKILLVK